MEYRPLGRTGLQVSVIGLGTMMFGEKTPYENAARIMDRAVDAGVNLFDVADVYAAGESERMVGRWLGERRGARDRVVLATKVGRPTDLGAGLSRSYILRAVEASLSRLQVDHIDLYQVHLWDATTPVEETLAALSPLVRDGKVRYVGCSNWAAWQLCKALWRSDVERRARMESVQPRYHLAHRAPEAELFPLCLDQQVGVLAYSPLAGGILTGKYLQDIPGGSRGWNNPRWRAQRITPTVQAAARAVVDAGRQWGRPPGQVALGWVLSHPAVTSALVGPRTPEQWEEALGAGDWSLTPAQAEALAEAGDPGGGDLP